MMTPSERGKLQQMIRAKEQEVATLRSALQRTHEATLKLEKQVNSLTGKVTQVPIVGYAPPTPGGFRAKDKEERDKLQKEVAILKRALSLDSPGILALVQEKEKLHAEVESLSERVSYLTGELEKTRTERETLKSARELMTPRPELSHRLGHLERENRRLVAAIDEHKLEIQTEHSGRLLAEQAKQRHQAEIVKLRDQLTTALDELETLREEKNTSQVEVTKLHQSLSVSALNESVMEDHVEKLKENSSEQNLLVARLRKDVLRLQEQLRVRDFREKELLEEIHAAENKHKESRLANKQREKEILKLHYELDRVQGFLTKQTAAQLKRLL